MAPRKWFHARPASRRKGTLYDPFPVFAFSRPPLNAPIGGAGMSIEQIALPRGVGPQASKLWDAIVGAASAADLNRAGGKAEGFVLGLESSKAIKSQVAESLYVAFDDAASQRSKELAG